MCMGAKNVDLVVVILSEVLLWPDSDTLARYGTDPTLTETLAHNRRQPQRNHDIFLEMIRLLSRAYVHTVATVGAYLAA